MLMYSSVSTLCNNIGTMLFDQQILVISLSCSLRIDLMLDAITFFFSAKNRLKCWIHNVASMSLQHCGNNVVFTTNTRWSSQRCVLLGYSKNMNWTGNSEKGRNQTLIFLQIFQYKTYKFEMSEHYTSTSKSMHVLERGTNLAVLRL